jgi:hypothetical protein
LEDSITFKYIKSDDGVDFSHLLPVRDIMRVATLLVSIMLSFEGLDLMWMADAKAQSTPGTPQEGSADVTTTESPAAEAEKKLKEDPVCDSTFRPKITKIEPDEFQAGAKVAIIGENFGEKKECLHSVTFGHENAKDFMLKGNERIEATAPDNLSTGMIFVNVVTGGGAARSAVLVKKKE